MRKSRGLDQKRRPERTLQVINGLNADIVVLQGADKRLGPRPSALPRKMIEAETDFELISVFLQRRENWLAWQRHFGAQRP
ncbi:hypothetical protein [Roseobacter sp.]|uniref:hypothetical protein n=1 Tax=Roseobacter sp. TaxID=1907202 RepID=UPI003858A1CD